MSLFLLSFLLLFLFSNCKKNKQVSCVWWTKNNCTIKIIISLWTTRLTKHKKHFSHSPLVVSWCLWFYCPGFEICDLRILLQLQYNGGDRNFICGAKTMKKYRKKQQQRTCLYRNGPRSWLLWIIHRPCCALFLFEVLATEAKQFCSVLFVIQSNSNRDTGSGNRLIVILNVIGKTEVSKCFLSFSVNVMYCSNFG